MKKWENPKILSLNLINTENTVCPLLDFELTGTVICNRCQKCTPVEELNDDSSCPGCGGKSFKTACGCPS